MKAGDTLLFFDDMQIETQVQQANDLSNNYAAQIKLYDQCISELENGKNTFKKTDFTQLPFYNAIILAQSNMEQYDVSDDQYKAKGYSDNQIKIQQTQNANRKRV